MRSAGGGRRRESDNGKVNGRGAGRGRGTVRMHNLRSTASEELEEKQDKTLNEKGGGKSDIRTYVHNGTPIQGPLMRRSPRDKKKEKNVTFKTKNNAGDNETSNDITTQVELEDKKKDENNRINETNEGFESPIDKYSNSWKIPMKTVKKRESRSITMTQKRNDSNTNTFDILMDNETEKQENESSGKKESNAIDSERSPKHTWYESSDDENSEAKRNERKISGSKRYHGNNSDEDKIQTKTAKSEETKSMEGIITYSESPRLMEKTALNESNDGSDDSDNTSRKKYEEMSDASESEDNYDNYSFNHKSDSSYSDNHDNDNQKYQNNDMNLHAYDSDEFVPPEVYHERQQNGANDKTDGSKNNKQVETGQNTIGNNKMTTKEDTNTVKIVATDTYEYRETLGKNNSKEVMARRGDTMLEDTISKYTPTKIEFNPKKENNIFNIRQALIELLKNMWLADKSIRVQSIMDNTIWGPSDMFPSGEHFMEHFKVQQIETKYNNNKIILHITLITSEEITRLKWRPQVRDYIFNHNIWFKEDKFEAQVSSTPGYFVGIHPRATNREVFTEYIKEVLNKVNRDADKQVVKKWMENNKDESKVPTFEIRIAIRKWGKIHSEVLSIECAKKNAQYMKYMISSAIEQKLLKDCLFIPIGIHLMKSPEVLASLLRKHNQHVATLATFDIFGLFPQMLTKPPTSEDNKTIDEHMRESKLIVQREKTPVTEDKGIWTIVVKKTNIRAAKELLETLIPSCTSRPQYNYDRRTSPSQTGPADEIIGSYATYLENIATSEGNDNVDINNMEFDVCETLKQRKTYKDILAGTNKNTHATQTSKQNAIPMGQVEHNVITSRTNESNQVIDMLKNKIESLETKLEKITSSDSIEETLKRLLQVNESTQSDKITWGNKHNTNEDNRIEQLINEKFAMFEKKQDQKLITVSEQITTSILKNVETTLAMYQNKMDTVADIIIQSSQNSNGSNNHFLTQPQDNTPKRDGGIDRMTITPASKLSMSGVGAV